MKQMNRILGMRVICIVVLAITLTVVCKAIEPISPKLVQSWLEERWVEPLTIDDVRRFSRQLSDRPIFQAISLPYCTNAEIDDSSQIGKSIERAVRKIVEKEHFVDIFSQANSVRVDSAIAVYEELAGLLKNGSASANLRLGCLVALENPGNVEVLFLPLLINTNLACFAKGDERQAILKQMKHTFDVIGEISRASVLAQILRTRLTLRIELERVSNGGEAEINRISLNVLEPVYPFALPILESQEFSSFIENTADPQVDEIGPVNLHFNASDLLSGFRDGELVSLPRSEYYYCMMGIMSDIVQLSSQSLKSALAVRDVAEQVIWLCIYSDDLKLASVACIRFADYRRCVGRAPDAIGEKIEIPALDEATVKRLGVMFARRTHILSNRVVDTKKLAAKNRRRATLYFQDRSNRLK